MSLPMVIPQGVVITKLPPYMNSRWSRFEAVALLQSLGFKLTAHKPVIGRPKDLVLGVKQGARDVHAGETIPRDRALTLVIGGGEIDSTMYDEEEDLDFDGLGIEGIDEEGEDFDIEL